MVPTTHEETSQSVSLSQKGEKRNGVGAPKKHRWTAIFSCQQTIPIIIEFQFAAKHLPRLDIVEV